MNSKSKTSKNVSPDSVDLTQLIVRILEQNNQLISQNSQLIEICSQQTAQLNEVLMQFESNDADHEDDRKNVTRALDD